MDIAKIRKKAMEKEAAGKSPEAAGGPQAQEPQELERPAPEGEAPPDEEEDAGAAEADEAATGPEEEAVVEPGAPPPVKPAPPAGEEQGEEVLELLTFTLAQEEFAFRVPEVEEIIRHQKITRVPTMPGYVCGITSLRGKIIPVIDLKARLILREGGKPEAGPVAEGGDVRQTGKILILAGPKGLIGATIDLVLGVVRFSQEKIFEPPSHLSEEELQYIEGVVTVGKRFISIIRAEAALTIEVL